VVDDAVARFPCVMQWVQTKSEEEYAAEDDDALYRAHAAEYCTCPARCEATILLYVFKG